MTSVASDIDFYFDPVCPFAWLASRWVEEVRAQKDYSVDWRFISLRILNRDIDYDMHFPDGYEDGHTAGLRMLRVAARAREEHGREAVGALYSALGDSIWNIDPPADERTHQQYLGTTGHVQEVLVRADLPGHLTAALDDDAWDEVIESETEEAVSLTGRDVGTPIIHFEPPGGVAFFGPVISRIPRGSEAIELWDHVIGLARFGGFAELKRSLRQRPQLKVMGEDGGQPAVEEDWQQGSRRRSS